MTDDPFKEPSDISGGSFFKPADHDSHAAIIFEPKSIMKGVPNTYKGKTAPRDELLADVTIFADQAALDAGKPTLVLKSTKIVAKYLVSDLEKIMGGVLLATVYKKTLRNDNTGWVFRNVEAAVKEKCVAYYTAREAEVAAAIADAPSFD